MSTIVKVKVMVDYHEMVNADIDVPDEVPRGAIVIVAASAAALLFDGVAQAIAKAPKSESEPNLDAIADIPDKPEPEFTIDHLEITSDVLADA